MHGTPKSALARQWVRDAKRLKYERIVSDYALTIFALVMVVATFGFDFKPLHWLPTPVQLVVGIGTGLVLGLANMAWERSIIRRTKKHPLYFLALVQREFNT